MLLNSRRHLCCLLVSGDCQMVWQNAKAIDQLQIEKSTVLADLYFSPASETSMKAAAGRLADAEPYTFLGIVVLKGAKEETIVCAAVSVKESSGEALLLLSEVDRLWRREFSDFLRDSFRLTDAEIEIVRQLVSGLTLNDIAEQNSKSLNTVRTQLKTIQRKTGAKSQVEIVRLVSGLFSVIDAPISAEGINIYRDGPSVFTTSEGWSCPVHVYGPKEGTPVLFLHGMLDGCGFTGKFVDQLERQRLRLIAPERPHFGDAGPDNGDIASAPQLIILGIENREGQATRCDRDHITAAKSAVLIKKTTRMHHMVYAGRSLQNMRIGLDFRQPTPNSLTDSIRSPRLCAIIRPLVSTIISALE